MSPHALTSRSSSVRVPRKPVDSKRCFVFIDRSILILVALISVFVAPIAAQSGSPSYRVNCGGGNYVDAFGNAWSSDMGFNTGSGIRLQASITQTLDPQLYQTARVDGVNPPTLRYRFPVQPGVHEVTLHFAEIDPAVTGSLQRVFDIVIENEVVLKDFDIFAVAGANQAYKRRFTLVVLDNFLEIKLRPVVGLPLVSAIEAGKRGGISPTITTTPSTAGRVGSLYQYDVDASDPNVGDVLTYSLVAAPTGATIDPASGLVTFFPDGNQLGLHPFTARVTDIDGLFDEQNFTLDVDFPLYRINCGAQTDFVDSLGRLWSADFGFNTGSFFATSSSVGGTPDPFIYETLRRDFNDQTTLTYQVEMTPGLYQIRFHFAELFGATPGVNSRIFDVRIEGQTLLDKLEIAAEAGLFTALQRDVQLAVTDNSLLIEFLVDTNDPIVNGIEIFEVTGIKPTITSTPAPTVVAGNTFSYDVDAMDPVPSSMLTYSLQQAPAAATIDAMTGLLTWPTTLGDIGQHAITVRAVNEAGILDDQNFTVDVLNPAAQPSIISTAITFATANSTYAYTVEAIDPNPGDVVTYSLSVAPAGATIDMSTGVLSWSPSLGQLGSHAVTARATDLGGLFDEQSFAIEVFDPSSGNAGVFHRINCGGNAYTDSLGNSWSADTGFNTGLTFSTGNTITGTADPALYQKERFDLAGGPDLTYSLSVPAPGSYRVKLHFAEIFAGSSLPGQRVFDVSIEGQLVLNDYDVAAEVGAFASVIKQFDILVTDGTVDITFGHVVENPKVNAIEVVVEVPSSTLIQSPTLLAWGHVALGQTGGEMTVQLENTGADTVFIDQIDFNNLTGQSHDFHVSLSGIMVAGDDMDVQHSVSLVIPPGGVLPLSVDFVVTEETDNIVDLVLVGNFPDVHIQLEGVGGEGGPHPFLHVVIDIPPYTVDFDGDGNEDVDLQGNFSHTHEPFHGLTAFEWSEGGMPFSTLADVTRNFTLGSHSVSLKIFDDNMPPETLTDTVDVKVVPPDEVPGSLLLYYVPQGVSAASLLNAPPTVPDFADHLGTLELTSSAKGFGVMVRFLAEVDITTAGSYEFVAVGGGSDLMFLDGQPVAGPSMLTAGSHQVDARFTIEGPGDLPIEIMLADGGQAAVEIGSDLISHDLSGFAPVINMITPAVGSEFGGNTVQITGLGFFLENEVVVNWGPVALSAGQLQIDPERITLTTPPGVGVYNVTVTTPRGTSNAATFTYEPDGPLPIVFAMQEVATAISKPTCVAVGPDERIYVGSQGGMIFAITVDDDYNHVATELIATMTSLSNSTILGIAFNPHDPPGPVKIYVAHGELYAAGFTGPTVNTPMSPFPYSGQISTLEGPIFALVTPLVTNLPVSNHDHSVNGMVFDNNGDLYVCVGGNTNAGIPSVGIGELPETPLSGAVIKVALSEPSFNGAITYVETISGTPNNDQIFGDIVDVAPGIDVGVYASGIRNSLDLVFTTDSLLFATDNGADIGFGDASVTGTTQQALAVDQIDKLFHIEFGEYYGHANRNRGRTDPRQNLFHFNSEVGQPGVFRAPMSLVPSSTNGIDEYRADTFNGAMRGNILTQRYNGETLRFELASDGRSVMSSATLINDFDSLGVVAGPGGVILGGDHSINRLLAAKPVETVTGLRVYDIFPWRAPATGGQSFVIGGEELGSLSETTVTIGGIAAVLTSVSDNRIRGTIPVNASPLRELVDVAVTVSGQSRVLERAFRYLLPLGTDPHGWRHGSAMPINLGEVASAVVDDLLYVFGEGNAVSQTWDFQTETWGTIAPRLFAGDHHTMEVVDGKLYVIGGLSNGSEGKVQIYDPDLSIWTEGTPMPWSAGSCSSAVIGGLIYVSGGIVGSGTVTNHAAYDPVADSWTALSPMPQGRNHAAAGTDGILFYVFGGRGPGSGAGNSVANGFANVQVYDLVTDIWISSDDVGSPLLPLPQARGGTGKAVFHQGEFYVMGGETLTGSGATPTDVYDRVDIYDPMSNSWRSGSPMPTPRHGIFPVLYQNQIWVAGGGTSAGASQVDDFDVYAPF